MEVTGWGADRSGLHMERPTSPLNNPQRPEGLFRYDPRGLDEDPDT
jgi:hypothetical protein